MEAIDFEKKLLLEFDDPFSLVESGRGDLKKDGRNIGKNSLNEEEKRKLEEIWKSRGSKPQDRIKINILLVNEMGWGAVFEPTEGETVLD